MMGKRGRRQEKQAVANISSLPAEQQQVKQLRAGAILVSDEEEEEEAREASCMMQAL